MVGIGFWDDCDPEDLRNSPCPGDQICRQVSPGLNACFSAFTPALEVRSACDNVETGIDCTVGTPEAFNNAAVFFRGSAREPVYVVVTPTVANPEATDFTIILQPTDE